MQGCCEEQESEEEVDGSILTRGLKFSSQEDFLNFMEEGINEKVSVEEKNPCVRLLRLDQGSIDVWTQDRKNPSVKLRRLHEGSIGVGVNRNKEEVDGARMKQFMILLQSCIDKNNRAESLELQVVRDFLRKAETNNPFSEGELDLCIKKMTDDNKLMRSDDTIYMI